MDSESCQQHSSMLTPRRHDSGHRRLPVVFWPIVFVLVFAPALSAGLELRTTSTPTGNSGAANSIAAQLHHSPIPFLPVHVHPIGVTVPATVNPTGFYNSEPAPMGIGDFGVGAGGKPYTYNTTEFLGNFSWQSLNLLESGDPYFTDQLNVVLHFVEGGTTYAYWIQDVAFMDSSTRELTFENNIWNFSASGCLSNSAVSGNGTVNAYSGCVGYYAVGASSQPGADEFMPSPGDFSLFVRSYLSTGGVPEVAFEYWDGVTSWEVTYNNVVWPWAKVGLSDYGFYVDGNTTAPNGIFYDAELTIGGPGGGSSTIAQIGTNIGSRLFYWNGHNLEAPRSVWNFGSDTAEAVSNVQSFFTHDRDGTPHTTQLNGTTRNATPARAYDQGQVGILSVSAPSISSGTVAVNGTPWNFLAGQATFTLVPGSYPVWVNSSSQHNNLGICAILGGQTTSVAVPGSCGLSVSHSHRDPVGSRRRTVGRLPDYAARPGVRWGHLRLEFPGRGTQLHELHDRFDLVPADRAGNVRGVGHRHRLPLEFEHERHARVRCGLGPCGWNSQRKPHHGGNGSHGRVHGIPVRRLGELLVRLDATPVTLYSHLHRFAHLSAGDRGHLHRLRQGHGLARLRSDEPDSGLHRPSGPLSQQPRCDTRRPNRCGGTGQLHGHRKRGRGLVQLHVAGPSHRLRFR